MVLRIGDFSKLARVSVRTLHYYDQIGLLRPAAVDDVNEYRYYRLDQLPELHHILALKEMGLSLDQIRRVLAERPTAEAFRALLEERRAALEASVRQTRETLTRLDTRLALLDADRAAEPAEMTLTAVTAVPVAFRRMTVPTAREIDAACAQTFHALHERLGALGVGGVRDLLLFHLDEYATQDLDLEVAVELDPDAAGRLPVAALQPFGLRQLPAEPRVASLVFEGSCGELPEAGRRLFRWLATAGYQSVAPSREIHHAGWRRPEGPDTPVVIELQLPVASVGPGSGLDPDAASGS